MRLDAPNGPSPLLFSLEGSAQISWEIEPEPINPTQQQQQGRIPTPLHLKGRLRDRTLEAPRDGTPSFGLPRDRPSRPAPTFPYTSRPGDVAAETGGQPGEP